MFTPINGFEGIYSISEYGEIYSHTRLDSLGREIGGKILNKITDKDGYYRITLSLGTRNNQKVFRIARLVAESFLPNGNNLPIVNHKDGNKQNDHYSNLEWCTSKENTRHAWDTGLCRTYDRKLDYNREGIIKSNQDRKKWTGTHKEYCKLYYEKVIKGGCKTIYD